MAVFEFWRDITPGSPDDTVNRYRYDTSDDSVIHDTFTTFSGTLGPIHPAVGTVMYSLCEDGDLIEYKSIGNNTGQNKVTTADSPGCCEIEITDFSIVRTNNTDLLTPNGTIKVTAPVLDIAEYEVSIDGGSTWETESLGEILFSGLPAGSYTVIIREISGVCNVTGGIIISDNISYPPLIASESTLPVLYAPVFHPITLGFTLDNNTAAVKQDVDGTYLEVDSDDAKDYLATLPIIKILQNEDYAGTYQVVSVDDVGDPNKFYVENLAYTTDQIIMFVPYDRQVFQLFAERSFNVFSRIANITVYPNESGEYLLRLEGFLQSVFKINAPVNMGDEIALLRRYYVVPQDFDMEETSTVLNAVYSAVPDLTQYLGELVPLGPAPINYINEQTQKGFPVLFSYIDLPTGRIKNVTSSNETDIVSTVPEVLILALPLNQYDFRWVNPAGAIGALSVSPALPDWITLLPSPADTVKLSIDTGTESETGDYLGDDYDGDDYLVGSPNVIVGCYEFEFFDGATLLFTLTICVFPIQSSNEVKCRDVLNIAWLNRQGGWSSAIFEGKRIHGIDIGTEKTFKTAGVLRRASVGEVYDTIEVTIFNKSIRDMEFIKSLRTSVQAFLWDENTLQWSISIKLDRASAPVYEIPFKQVEVLQKMTFKLAEEIVIQTQ